MGLYTLVKNVSPVAETASLRQKILRNLFAGSVFRGGDLKRGQHPPLNRGTIDFSAFEQQQGDPEPTPFSLRTTVTLENKICCYVTYTDERIHSLIRDNIHRSPLYSGQIRAIGPRYCPSIEDKVVKFQDKDR